MDLFLRIHPTFEERISAEQEAHGTKDPDHHQRIPDRASDDRLRCHAEQEHPQKDRHDAFSAGLETKFPDSFFQMKQLFFRHMVPDDKPRILFIP